jgi:hypothetical protein
MAKQFDETGVLQPVRRGWREDVRLVGKYMRDGGTGLLVEKGVSRVRHMFAGRK